MRFPETRVNPPSISNKEQLSLDAASATFFGQLEPFPTQVIQMDLGSPLAPFLKQTSSLLTPTLPYSTSNEEQLSLDAAFPIFGQLKPFLAEGFQLDLRDISLTRQSDDGASDGEQLTFADRLMSTQTSHDGTSDEEQLAFADRAPPSPVAFPVDTLYGR